MDYQLSKKDSPDTTPYSPSFIDDDDDDEVFIFPMDDDPDN